MPFIFSISHVTEPATSTTFPEDYLQRVRTVHEFGGYGSQGLV